MAESKAPTKSTDLNGGAGCLLLALMAALAIALLVVALCIAVGVALWFAIRFAWRKVSNSGTENRIVEKLASLPSMARKVSAGIVCAAVSVGLIIAIAAPGLHENEEQPEQPSQTEVAQTQEQTYSSENNQETQKSSKWWEMSADEFIEKYNATASVPFVEEERFSPKDKGTHYRTEYRTIAFDNAEGVHGTIGECSVDIVSYRDGVRTYAVAPGQDDMTLLFENLLSIYAPDADQEKVAKFESDSFDKSKSSQLIDIDNGLNGYMDERQLMIERTGK